MLLSTSDSMSAGATSLGHHQGPIYEALGLPEREDKAVAELSGDFVPPFHDATDSHPTLGVVSSWAPEEIYGGCRASGEVGCRRGCGFHWRMRDACAGAIYDLCNLSRITPQHLEAESFETKLGFVLMRHQRLPYLLLALQFLALLVLAPLFMSSHPRSSSPRLRPSHRCSTARGCRRA